MVFCYGTTLRLDLTFFNDHHPSFLCSGFLIRTLPLIGPNSQLTLLSLSGFLLSSTLPPASTPQLSFLLLSRWLEFFRLRDYSAQPPVRRFLFLIIPLPVSTLLALPLFSVCLSHCFHI